MSYPGCGTKTVCLEPGTCLAFPSSELTQGGGAWKERAFLLAPPSASLIWEFLVLRVSAQ